MDVIMENNLDVEVYKAEGYAEESKSKIKEIKGFFSKLRSTLSR